MDAGAEGQVDAIGNESLLQCVLITMFCHAYASSTSDAFITLPGATADRLAFAAAQSHRRHPHLTRCMNELAAHLFLELMFR